MNGREEREEKIFSDLDYKARFVWPPYMGEWYSYLRANGSSATTCRTYTTFVWNMLFKIRVWEVELIKPEEITADIVIKYILDKRYKVNDSGETEKTTNSYQSSVYFALNNFLEFMCNRKYIKENYIKTNGIKRPKGQDRIKRYHLEKEDFHKLAKIAKENSAFDYSRARDYAILMLFLTTGMRRGAMSSINIGDLDIDEREITVVDKGERVHKYILTEQTVDAISNWLEFRQMCRTQNDALFLNRDGGRLSDNAICKSVKSICKEALGYELSPHKLRAGFITIMIEETGDIMATCEAVGHANVRTTQRYYAANGRGKRMAAQVMSDL